MTYIRDRLHNHPKFASDLEAALRDTFHACDAAMAAERLPSFHSGTTAVVAVLFNSHLTIASVGDSRAVVAKSDGDGGAYASGAGEKGVFLRYLHLSSVERSYASRKATRTSRP